MRSSALRLLPAVALAAAICLVMTGMLGQARTGLEPQRMSARGSASLPRAPGSGTDGVSTRVGAIPGAPTWSHSRWPFVTGPSAGASVITAKALSRGGHQWHVAGRLHQPDVLVVAPTSLPAGLLARIRGMRGVAAATPADAASITVNGVFVNVLGVNPYRFRPFAARPTAESATLWQNVAAGGMAISYTMGRQDRLSLARPVRVTGTRTLKLPVAGFGTVGIGGIDAVVSRTVASALGLPTANAIVISAPGARLDALIAAIRKQAPPAASVTALVTQVTSGGATYTIAAAGALGVSANQGPGLTSRQVATFLRAAESRLGMPYVWGGTGPTTFDCSGLVQWAMARAGVVMPRVAADQARTGPLLPLRQLRPGDLLFYHTDPTAPGYISHVAIYLGQGLMLQAPEPGMNVEVVPADFGAGFAGAVRVFPALAAQVAASAAG